MKAGDVVDEPSPPAAPGIQLERRDPETLDVGGHVLNAESSAADLKSACRTLGIGATGSKSVLFKRLVKHMQRKEAEESLSLQDAAKLASRQPVAERVPKPPSPEQIALRTHIPFEKWCPICVSTRSRRDRHVQGSEAHRSEGGIPSIAMDFFYVDLDGTELSFMQPSGKSHENKALILACVCSDTGMLRAIPLPGKGRSFAVCCS